MLFQGLTALHWIDKNCKNAKWIFKSDDDIVINIFEFRKKLKSLEEIYSFNTTEKVYKPPIKNQTVGIENVQTKNKTLLKNMFFCKVWARSRVYKEGKNCHAKQCITEEEWPGDFFPPYCSGSTFLFPVRTSRFLLNAYTKVPFFWIDDIYITGILSLVKNIQHYGLDKHYNLYSHLTGYTYKKNDIFVHYPKSVEKMTIVWNTILKNENKTIT